MLIRLTDGNGKGLSQYLKDGQKQDRYFTRDQLDDRMILNGDLDVFDGILDTMLEPRYKHITLSFKEKFLSPQTIHDIADEFKKFIGAAYKDDEFYFYAEAHIPKIKSYPHPKTGEVVERLPHIHVAIPLVNLVSGNRLDPFGLVSKNIRYIDSFQEYVNQKYELESPKNSPRISSVNQIDRLGGRDFLGRDHLELKTIIAEKVMNGEIRTIKELAAELSKIGTVNIANKNKNEDQQYVRLITTEGEAIRFRSQMFRQEFLSKTLDEKKTILIESQNGKKSYLDKIVLQNKLTTLPENFLESQKSVPILQYWHDIRAKELKFFDGKSKFYKDSYRHMNDDEKREALKKFDCQFDEKWRNDEHRIKQHSRRKNFATRGDCLRGVSPLHLDETERRPALLLPDSSLDNLDAEQGKENRDSRMRRSFHSSRLSQQEIEHVEEVKNEKRVSVAQTIKSDLVKASAIGQMVKNDEMAEIRKNLDAGLLLSILAESHGLQPDHYSVTVNPKTGAPAILAGRRRLSLPDFLTKEMALPWPKAKAILEHAYDQQVAGIRSSPEARTDKNERDKKQAEDLWQEFYVSHFKPLLDTNRQELSLFSEQAKQTRKEFTRKARANVSRFKKQPIELSIAKMETLKARAEMNLKITKKRETLKKPNSRQEFKKWLQKQVELGREDALKKLKAMSRFEKHNPELDSISSPESGLEMYVIILQSVNYNVRPSGDVLYYLPDNSQFVDTGRRITFEKSEKSDAAILAALSLATEKFGSDLSLTGSEDFKRRAKEIAKREGLRIKIDGEEMYQQEFVRMEKNRNNLGF